MTTYSVYGFTAVGNSASSPIPVCQLWNPSSTERICLWEIGLSKAGTVGTRFAINRALSRGSPGSTITPDADNAWQGDDVPRSGVLFDLANWGSVTGAEVPPLMGINNPDGVTGAAGSGWVWRFDKGLWIKPGTGVVVNKQTSELFSSHACYAVWEEG